jgi:hypothetical protein
MTAVTLARRATVAAALLAGLQLATRAQEVERSDRTDRIERAFVRGGRIVMDLSAGAYTIRGGAAESIRVRWATRDPRDRPSVRTDVTVSGSKATIRTRGPKNNFRVDVDVPAIADIQLDLSAGELLFRGVEGNKSVSMWAGEVTMEVGDAQLYRRVDLTVRAGEIQAIPFGGTRGGLMRSFRWDGSGKYTIIARLFAGEVRLVK